MDNDCPPADHQADLDAIARIPAIPKLLDIVCRMTGMGFAAVARVTEESWTACSVKDDMDFGLRAGGRLEVDTTICREVRQHRRPVAFTDAASDETYRGHPTPALYGFRSYISVPIVLPDGTFFGTLCALDPQPRAIDTPEIAGSFEMFADLIALHIDAQRRAAGFEAALTGERAASALREQFIAVLGHDLRSPLASVAAGTRLLATHPERSTEIAGHIERSIARMAGLIDDVMDFARGRLGGGLAIDRVADADIATTLDTVIGELRSTNPDRVIAVDVDLVQPVACDAARVGQVLSNLLGNALTHGAPAGPVRVRASAAAGVFELSVCNAGGPIPSDMLPDLFKPFVRGAARTGRQGLGLGLYIAAEIARAHGGTIDVASTPTETCFRFRIPTGT